LEEGDIDEALSAAHAVGDDAIQAFKDIQNPLHGTSKQRKAWFMKGYKSETLIKAILLQK
jgi:predicted metalloprotease